MRGFRELTPVTTALALLVESVSALPAIRMSTVEAHGLVLASSVDTPIDLPLFDRSAMDDLTTMLALPAGQCYPFCFSREFPTRHNSFTCGHVVVVIVLMPHPT